MQAKQKRRKRTRRTKKKKNKINEVRNGMETKKRSPFLLLAVHTSIL